MIISIASRIDEKSPANAPSQAGAETSLNLATSMAVELPASEAIAE
ncbi:MAG: hypothetical protein WBQ20_15115 [Methyloceanibacter sp.]